LDFIQFDGKLEGIKDRIDGLKSKTSCQNRSKSATSAKTEHSCKKACNHTHQQSSAAGKRSHPESKTQKRNDGGEIREANDERKINECLIMQVKSQIISLRGRKTGPNKNSSAEKVLTRTTEMLKQRAVERLGSGLLSL